jgi:hypothetical protein
MAIVSTGQSSPVDEPVIHRGFKPSGEVMAPVDPRDLIPAREKLLLAKVEEGLGVSDFCQECRSISSLGSCTLRKEYYAIIVCADTCVVELEVHGKEHRPPGERLGHDGELLFLLIIKGFCISLFSRIAKYGYGLQEEASN